MVRFCYTRMKKRDMICPITQESIQPPKKVKRKDIIVLYLLMSQTMMHKSMKCTQIKYKNGQLLMLYLVTSFLHNKSTTHTHSVSEPHFSITIQSSLSHSWLIQKGTTHQLQVLASQKTGF
jgi:hypothetical protein